MACEYINIHSFMIIYSLMLDLYLIFDFVINILNDSLLPDGWFISTTDVIRTFRCNTLWS